MMHYKKIGIIGGGAWGLAIASLQIADQVIIFSSRDERLLGGIPSNITHVTKDFSLLADLDCIFITTPSAYFRNTVSTIVAHAKNKPDIIICSKGFGDNGELLSDIVSTHLTQCRVGILSGPNFASEIIKKMPTGSLFASDSADLFYIVQNSLRSITLHHSIDMIGCQFCGAIKNVFGIASGMLIGMGFEKNTHSMMITKALSELMSIIIEFGGDKQTALTLAGIGDLLLTCGSLNSRNTVFGYEFIKSNDINKALAGRTVEGYITSFLLNKKGIVTPIIDVIYKILYEKTNPNELLNAILLH